MISTRTENADHAIAPRRRGFTVMEIMLVSAMTSFLVLLISGAWAGLGRSSTDAIARCRVTQEANMALKSLARDFGGSLAEEGTGNRLLGRAVGRLAIAGSTLWLCFDGQPLNGTAEWAAPDTVIAYQVQAGRLVRSNLQTGASFTVAANVESMQLVEAADEVTIDLTFRYRDVVRTYTIVAKDP